MTTREFWHVRAATAEAANARLETRIALLTTQLAHRRHWMAALLALLLIVAAVTCSWVWVVREVREPRCFNLAGGAAIEMECP